MTTEWFTKHPFSPGIKKLEDGYMTVHGVPDWVIIPPDYGGGRARVVESFHAKCACHVLGYEEHGADALLTDRKFSTGESIGVFECKNKGFVWFAGSFEGA